MRQEGVVEVIQNNNFPSSKSQCTVNIIQFCFDFFREHLRSTVANNFGTNWEPLFLEILGLENDTPRRSWVQNDNFPSSNSQRTVNIIQFCFDFFREHLRSTVANNFGTNWEPFFWKS